MCHWAPCQWGAVGFLNRREGACGTAGLGGRSLDTGQRREVEHGLWSDGEESQWRGRKSNGRNLKKERGLHPSPHYPVPRPSALMVMCQHNLPSGLTNKTALIQHPGLAVDTRWPAKMSNPIGNVWKEAHINDFFYWNLLLLVHSPMLFTICLFIALAFIHWGDCTPGALILC